MNHFITFQRNPADGQHRAQCSCGWSVSGEREEVTNAAAVHDLDSTFPNNRLPVRRKFFVSGAYRGNK